MLIATNTSWNNLPRTPVAGPGSIQQGFDPGSILGKSLEAGMDSNYQNFINQLQTVDPGAFQQFMYNGHSTSPGNYIYKGQ